LPLGWTELTRPFAGERWWALTFPLATFALTAGLAFKLASRRDLGAGLLPARPGRPVATRALRGPQSLAWRLQWPSLTAWAMGYLVLFAVCGAAATDIGQLAGTSGTLRTGFTRLGGQSAILDAYLAGLMLLAGLGAAGYGVATVLRLRTEEAANRAEPVLAAAVGRVRWGLSHILVAVAGMALLLATGGAATGLGEHALASGSGPSVAALTGAALAQLPAALVVTAVAACACGLAAGRSVMAGWTGLAVAVALSLFGPLLRLPSPVLDLSPFTHSPHLPGGALPVASLAWLTGIALGLFAAGLAGLRARDIAP
ncbi:MAG TPA: ABC transporter permease, partial [Trebonia sp.]|nr:ABC transporter permease [Trebonia sp.]